MRAVKHLLHNEEQASQIWWKVIKNVKWATMKNVRLNI